MSVTDFGKYAAGVRKASELISEEERAEIERYMKYIKEKRANRRGWTTKARTGDQPDEVVVSLDVRVV